MGSVSSRDQSSEGKIDEGDVVSSPQRRSTRKRSTVKPPDQPTQEVSHFKKISTTIDNVYYINKKWDYMTIGFIVIGLFLIAIFFYFIIPAYYEYLHQKLSS